MKLLRLGKARKTETMTDPYDDDYRAPWNDPEQPRLGYLEEADYYEEHNEQ